MTNVDIRTRVELRNETQRETNKLGTAGKVALIGAFPSSKQKIFAAENYSQIVGHYGVTIGTTDVYWYDGVRAARRIFMEGIRGYGGANSITCLNTCTLKPTNPTEIQKEYIDSVVEEEKFDQVTASIVSGNDTTSHADIQPSETIKNDISLSFPKLQNALHQIADEDMDLLFISGDLREIFNHPLTVNELYDQYAVPLGAIPKKTITKEGEKGWSVILDKETNALVTTISNGKIYLKSPYDLNTGEEVELDTTEKKAVVVFREYINGEKYPQKTIELTNAQGKVVGTKTMLDYTSPELIRFVVFTGSSDTTKTVEAYYQTSVPVGAKPKRTITRTGVEKTWRALLDKTTGELLTVTKNGKTYLKPVYDKTTGDELQLGTNEQKAVIVFREYVDGKKYPSYQYTAEDGGTYSRLAYDDPELIKHVVFNVPVAQSFVVTDENDETVYGRTNQGKYIRNLGDVYNYILDFVDNEFTSHRPVNYVGAICTQGTPEGRDVTITYDGVPSNYIKLNSKLKTLYQNEDAENAAAKRYNPDGSNPFWNIAEFGALDIAKLFKRKTNELSTCGLFYQGGIINGETVTPMELAAHMCGWICSLNISQDLTYQTIPGLTYIDEEPFLGENDAGTLLNQAGIQIIRPKNRLDKTFYVNNSIMPSGWHTNHIRSVTYLLKRLQFENGLGINNFTTNIESFRALLETVAKEVLDECEVIRSVNIGEIEVINSYHIFVPVSIVLAGVVTLINVGVSMALDETGKLSTRVKSTSGYSLEI